MVWRQIIDNAKRAGERSPVAVFFAVFGAFFALYALTAQRGLGWADSGEFQHWALDCTSLLCGASFSNAHPLYVALARFAADTPYGVTLVSSFFGALSVAGFFLCSRNPALSVLFGFSQMLWRLSCLAEVQTMSLAFTVFGVAAFQKWIATRRTGWFALAAFLAGLHLACHNFALLLLPVYGVAALVLRLDLKGCFLSAGAFAVGAAGWIYAIFTRGAQDVFVGRYGAAVSGFLPQDLRVALFNAVLASLSFAVPVGVALVRARGALKANSWWMWGFFGVNFLFFVRYFVPDQATFLLPTLFFFYLLLAKVRLSVRATLALALVQVLLPVCLYGVLSLLPAPEERTRLHPYRNEASYFALPWKFHDDSADRCAKEEGGVWNGYRRPYPEPTR